MLILISLVVIMKILPVIGNSLFIVTRDSCRDRIVECLMSSMATTPACGSDGITYSSYCQVISKQCQGQSIVVNYIGSCLVKSPCFLLRQRSPPSTRPICNPDGTFSTIQCHKPSGYCWCVTPRGKRLANTLIQHQKPRCIRAISATQLSSNITPNIFKRQPMTAPIWKRRWQCDAAQMSQFIENLVAKFAIEYSRIHANSTNKTEIIQWKFHSLDVNKNNYLDWMEYEELLRLMEKVVTPRKCSRLFSKICDTDRDLRVSTNEWIKCLTDSSVLPMAGTPSRRTGVLLSDEGEATDNEEDNGADDCPSKRLLALKYQRKTAQENLFIPECEEGKYRIVQCYSGFCWCVNTETGLSIPKTSTSGENPNCNNETIRDKIMRGCPQEKYKSLLNDIMAVMKNRLNASAINATVGSSGTEESAAVWTFFLLDTNKNKVLQRGTEWRSIRMMVPQNRCGKKLPRFCDVNGDFGISISEWLNCFSIGRPVRIRGSNPIAMLHSV